MPVKKFEEKQLDWWCNFYRTSAKDLAVRTRQYLNGEISVGMLEAMLKEVEKHNEWRENHA